MEEMDRQAGEPGTALSDLPPKEARIIKEIEEILKADIWNLLHGWKQHTLMENIEKLEALGDVAAEKRWMLTVLRTQRYGSGVAG